MTVDRDLETAGRLQRMLLPPPVLTAGGWEVAHQYHPAGIVSGDYVDLVAFGDRLYFMLGDVSGKGVAAAMLMAQLHAMFRSLLPTGLSLAHLMARASALLCESSLPAQYATLVCGCLGPDGHVEIANAGHLPPLLIRGTSHTAIRATGVPIGLFCESQFSSTRLAFDTGDTLLIVTDGITEARDANGDEYGAEGVERATRNHPGQSLSDFVQAQIAEQERFRGGCPNTDDVTVLALRRQG